MQLDLGKHKQNISIVLLALGALLAIFIYLFNDKGPASQGSGIAKVAKQEIEPLRAPRSPQPLAMRKPAPKKTPSKPASASQSHTTRTPTSTSAPVQKTPSRPKPKYESTEVLK